MSELENLEKQIDELFEKNDFKGIIELLKESNIEKFNNSYLYAVRGRANIMLKNDEKAIKDYDKSISLDKEIPSSYNNRGIALQNLKQFEKALKDFNKAIELKPSYANYYNSRGNLKIEMGDFVGAINDLKQAIELDSQYYRAYLNLGEVYFRKEKFSIALTQYEKAKEIVPEFAKFINDRIKLINEKISERKILQETKAIQKDKNAIIKIENEIQKITNKIRAASVSEVKTIVHYTKLSVADIYVKKPSVKMHYSNAIYMNDPMEGKIFFEYLNNSSIEEAYFNGEKRTETSVYLGSFLPAEENNGEISHEDELVMWRTYGKDELGREAAGCNVVLTSDFFNTKTDIDNSDLSKQVETIYPSGYEEELLNVAYVKKTKNTREILNDSKAKIGNQMSQLKKKLLSMIILRNKYEKKSDFYKEIENTIFRQLSSISYLFKSSDYSFENEVRIIIYMPRDSDSIKFYGPFNSPQVPKTFYIESNNDILPFIKKIYLGPKVETYQQWGLYMDYEIRQRAKELNNLPDSMYQINPSEIEIIKSECKFQ